MFRLHKNCPKCNNNNVLYKYPSGDRYCKKCKHEWKENNPIHYKIFNFFLDKIDDLFRKINNMKHFLYNWYHQTNLINTGVKRGEYCDIVSLMEFGLLELVDDFVSKNKENAFDIVDYSSCEEDIEDRKKIIEVLHFKHIKKPEMEKEFNKLLHEIYGDSSVLDCDKEFRDKNKDKIDRLHEIEDNIFNETQRILHIIIDLRPRLWS